MEADLASRIASNPKYQELKAKRTSFGWWLALAMMIVYYGFILLVAFNKPLLATRMGEGVMTLGIPIGFGANIVLLRKHRGRIDMMPSVLLAGIFSTLIALPFALPLAVSVADLGLISVMGVLQLAIGLLLMVLAPLALIGTIGDLASATVLMLLTVFCIVNGALYG